MDISGGRLRTLRAALFTALCVALSAASHVVLSGRPLPPSALAAAGAGVFGLAYALAGRERGYGAIAALLVPLELASGALFTAGQDTCFGPDGRPAPGALALICGGSGVGHSLTHFAAPATVPWLLLAAHVTVGLLAAAWLRRGEAALGRLLYAAVAAAFRPLLRAAAALAAPACPGGPAARPVRRAGATPSRPLLLHSLPRRGPPVRPALG
ncbi:hypothetical protein AB0K09_20480 [Streptomyces sp. NPDC049577]|uniref:hypothetical protein n=1 Tax=Streptomyces sp. NPDC049577 TaxID=3155153 RepID=UPI00342CD24E